MPPCTYLIDCAFVILKDPLLLGLAGDTQVPEDDGPVGCPRSDKVLVVGRPDHVVATHVVIATLTRPQVQPFLEQSDFYTGSGSDSHYKMRIRP